MKSFAGKNILITGGGSGIGKIMTRILLERGANVTIWDISQENIDLTVAAYARSGFLTSDKVDISDFDQVQQAAARLRKEVGAIDVLINNAGIVVGKYFHEHTVRDITKTMDINATAPMIVTLEFIQGMLEQDHGHICNIASSASLISNPRMSVYAASKWSLLGWSDSLRLEMQQLKTKVKVTTILPYYINTGMFDGVESKVPILEPEYAANAIIKAIETNRKIISLPEYIYRTTRFSQGIMPRKLYEWIMNDILGVYSTMAHFTGRKPR